jgi:hypothetical protein
MVPVGVKKTGERVLLIRWAQLLDVGERELERAIRGTAHHVALELRQEAGGEVERGVQHRLLGKQCRHRVVVAQGMQSHPRCAVPLCGGWFGRVA